MSDWNETISELFKMGDADYRKLNDGSHNSSTYHKKDGTNTREILKRESKKQIEEETDENE